MRRLLPALLACTLPLVACALPPAPPTAALPPDAVSGAGDPTRMAILNTAYAFGTPAVLSGQPGEAARAVAQVEYLAGELASGPRWIRFRGIVAPQMQGAQAELRQVLGVAPGAPPQAVVDSLYAASRALRAGDRAGAEQALRPDLFPAGGAATLARLSALPPLPRTRAATVLAQEELQRDDLSGMRGRPGGSF
ncbi:hypothetical protein M0638_20000 [Roseomonas sp. NAR14]|uniref:Uncharacterized protein n=1 Tax=Roseomonas acroporae TaxID=2937791 RepID=A0A9X1YAR8_9PROT|nr:hypothetical protein [Roseomonas acroporae]MCK8786663.1 hypothetical protein [Roseomonas acroporae]